VDGIRQIAVVQEELLPIDLGIRVEMINTTRRERAGPPNDTMDFIALGDEEIGEIGSILPGNTCY